MTIHVFRGAALRRALRLPAAAFFPVFFAVFFPVLFTVFFPVTFALADVFFEVFFLLTA
ncbi:MAG: hypothetical protein ACREKH_00755 [Candidatus Rokuibacteriota bacterium]